MLTHRLPGVHLILENGGFPGFESFREFSRLRTLDGIHTFPILCARHGTDARLVAGAGAAVPIHPVARGDRRKSDGKDFLSARPGSASRADCALSGSLLAQVLMASTYPLEVVEAARWVKANPKVSGAALETAMARQSWDPAVKSLTAVPQVVQQMSDNLDWMQKLGDAFLAQQQDVMDTVQGLRARADTTGHLKTTEKQVVKPRHRAARQST
jgi:hypothetical protein